MENVPEIDNCYFWIFIGKKYYLKNRDEYLLNTIQMLKNVF